VGIFYATWLFWVGMGAAAARTRPGAWLLARLARRRRAGLLLYLPLAAAQYTLLGALRAGLGVAAYAAFPAGLLALGCLLANAPVSLATGLLLPAALRARQEPPDAAAVARAFAWEGLGAALGGVAITLLLWHSPPLARLWDRADWRRTFGRGAPDLSFTTPAGRYLSGEVGGARYVLGCGGVTDHWPDPERGRELAAMLLTAMPAPRSVLLLGEAPASLALALRAQVPDAALWWCHHDPAYAHRVAALAGAATAGDRGGWRVWPSAPPALLDGAAEGRGEAGSSPRHDLIVCWPPAAMSDRGAAWWRTAWLRRVALSMTDRGVVALPLGMGDANWSELAAAGAAIRLAQARAVWPQTLPVAGAEGWLLASTAAGVLPASRAEAVARQALQPRSPLPAAALAWLFDESRAAAWEQRLRAARGPVARRPEVRLRSLALAADWQMHLPAAAWMRLLLRFDGWRGMLGISAALLCLVALPLALAGRRTPAASGAVAIWLGCGGAMALAGSLGVMSLLQVRFGSLYLLAGAAAGCYLCGMATGNLLMARATRAWRRDRRLSLWHWMSLLTVVAQLALLALLAAWAEQMRHAWQGVAAMWLAGLPAGCYVPVALAWAGERGGNARAAAGALRADNWGGALGGALWVLALQPLLGSAAAFASLAAPALVVALLGRLQGRRRRLAAAGVALAACLAAWRLTCPAMSSVTTGSGGGVATSATAPVLPGTANDREVPLERLRERIRAGTLVDREAEYWEVRDSQ